MGKSAAKQSQKLAAEAANRYTTLATNLSAESSPARALTQDYYSKVVKGGPEAYRLAAPEIDFTKTAFANARRQLAQSAPAGGATAAGSKQLASGEAATISSLFREKIQEALRALTQIGQFGTGAELSAVGGIGNTSAAMANLSAMRAQAVASGVGGIAGAIGTYFGMKG